MLVTEIGNVPQEEWLRFGMRLGLDRGDNVWTEGSVSDYGEREGKETGSKRMVDGWTLMGEASGLSCRAGFSEDGQGGGLRSTRVSCSAQAKGSEPKIHCDLSAFLRWGMKIRVAWKLLSRKCAEIFNTATLQEDHPFTPSVPAPGVKKSIAR